MHAFIAIAGSLAVLGFCMLLGWWWMDPREKNALLRERHRRRHPVPPPPPPDELARKRWEHRAVEEALREPPFGG